jgi:hypothetical protein
MKDLEINVSGIIDVTSYFKGLSNETPPDNGSALFPSLRRLRFIVSGRNFLVQKEVDKLVQRILLPSTEVIVSPDDGLYWHDEGNIEVGLDGTFPVFYFVFHLTQLTYLQYSDLLSVAARA